VKLKCLQNGAFQVIVLELYDEESLSFGRDNTPAVVLAGASQLQRFKIFICGFALLRMCNIPGAGA